MNQSILITGANSGLGKDAARQLALLEQTEKIYLGCRNEAKAQAAKADLEAQTGRSIFEIVIMDVSKPDSVRAAVAGMDEPVDALIMNAGGMGGKTPFAAAEDGVLQIYAANLMGHVVLLDELVAAGKLKKVALYAGSEAARGIAPMGMKPPSLQNNSVAEFKSILDGSFFTGKKDPMEAYALAKYIAALWMSAQARKTAGIRFITMSPGATSGTSVMDNMTGILKIMFKYVMMPIVMPLMGMVHDVATGAKRYLQGINDESLQNGGFYASASVKPTGPVALQGTFLADLDNAEYQDNADAALHAFLS